MAIEIPADLDSCDVKCGAKKVTLTNLQKVVWPKLKKTKRDLLLYYAAVAPALLPHLKDRALVMKRYPNGIEGKFFFIKRTPLYRPDWLKTCLIAHKAGSVIDLPMAQDLASLLWIVNLGCIDLNPWHARCDDLNRPHILYFDLDPVPPAGFEQVRKAALLVRVYLEERQVESYPKTTGSRRMHIYVPIQRNPLQKEVWRVAKRIAMQLAKLHPEVITAEYRVSLRPAGRVLVDYNQNAWARTAASVYSVRPRPQATVSTPLTWEEVKGGIAPLDLTMDTVPERIRKLGDLFKPVLRRSLRYHLESLA